MPCDVGNQVASNDLIIVVNKKEENFSSGSSRQRLRGKGKADLRFKGSNTLTYGFLRINRSVASGPR